MTNSANKLLLIVVGAVLLVGAIGAYSAVSSAGCEEPPGFVEASQVAEPPADANVVTVNEWYMSSSSPIIEVLAKASNSTEEFARVGLTSEEACAYETTTSDFSRYNPEAESRATEVGYYFKYDGEIYQVVRFEEY